MAIDAILVPQGAECETVRWAAGPLRPVPEIVALPVGPAPVRRFLDERLRGATWQRALVTGLCGGLAPGLRPGDLVVYESCQLVDSPSIECCRELLGAIEAALPEVYPVRGLTCEAVIAVASRKRQCAARHRVQVADMESFAALECLARRGVSAGVLRVVGDECDQDLPDLSASFDSGGTLQPVALAAALLGEPYAGVRLVGSALVALAALARAAPRLAAL